MSALNKGTRMGMKLSIRDLPLAHLYPPHTHRPMTMPSSTKVMLRADGRGDVIVKAQENIRHIRRQRKLKRQMRCW